jgi:Arc/MetJ-type ribon-helix-helix transcriptional regulator
MDDITCYAFCAYGVMPSDKGEEETKMAKAQRVIFSFDERSLESLQQMRERGRFSSMAEAVRESLQTSRALQAQAEQGYTELVVRNPETGEERVLVIPTLHTSPR